MDLKTNGAFVESVESVVCGGLYKCGNCGQSVTIRDSLLKCDGPCGYGASLILALDESPLK